MWIEQNKIIEKTVSVENPVSEKSVSVKTEKPLIDLPSQREKVNLKLLSLKLLKLSKNAFWFKS